MKTEVKYVVKDVIDGTYRSQYCGGDFYWGTPLDQAVKFNTKEEAWENAGIYCTVIPVRFN